MALEFTETFNKGQQITEDDIPTIMQCKNIDYDHVNWNIRRMYKQVLTENTQFMMHLVHNVIDINSCYVNGCSHYSFICNIIIHSDDAILKYVINNRGFNKKLLSEIKSRCMVSMNQYLMFDKLLKLSKYLNKKAVHKFPGYYNLERYYNMMHTMLLVMKVQTIFPKCVIERIIIPFIYR